MRSLVAPIVAAAALVQPVAALAQTSPSPMERERADQRRQEPASRTQPPTRPGRQTAGPAITPFVLRDVQIEGGSVPPAVLERAWRPFVGRTINAAELQAITDAISRAYERETDIALYTILAPNQSFRDGVLRLLAVEGAVARVNTGGAGSDIIRRYAEPITSERPLSRSTLQRSVSLIRDVPGLYPKIEFKPTNEQGVVELDAYPDLRRWEFAAAVNSRGTSYLGRTQIQLDAFANSALASGDQARLTLAFPTDAERFQYAGLSYSAPVGGQGVRVGGNVSWLRTKPESLNLEGEAVSAGLQVSWPVLRDYRRSLYLTGSIDGVNSENALFGQTISNDRIRSLRGGASWAWTDEINLVTASAVASSGLSGLGARVTDPAFATADFRKLNLRAGYSRLLNPSWVVRLNGAAQLSGDRLPATEQFALGGEEFARGFESAYVVGDTGRAASAELVYRPQGGLPDAFSGSELYGFADAGSVRLEARPGLAEREYEVSSAGVGARISIKDRTVVQVEANKRLETPAGFPEKDEWRFVFGARTLF